MRIAIFGGAFNPVHREHVNLAKAAVKELALDKIIIMPSAISPHKTGRPVVDFWRRFEMCRLAFSCVKQAEVSNYELTRGGVSYTCLTSSYFRALYPHDELYFLIGADMLKSFPTWKNPREILNNLTLAACARETTESFFAYKQNVEKTFDTRVETISYVGDAVSSTRVRTLAALGENFCGYVDEKVWQYISGNGVYALPRLWKVKDMTPQKRWQHTVNVAVLCAENAPRAGVSEEQAVTMAALHDCAKYLENDSPYLKGFTCPDGVPQPVVHQYAGAYVAEHVFGITDKTVLDAIACHTSGKENMSGADKLLFLADVLEESRTFEGVEELRLLFRKDIDECLKEQLKRQTEYLDKSGAEVYGLTRKAYDYIKEKNK